MSDDRNCGPLESSSVAPSVLAGSIAMGSVQNRKVLIVGAGLSGLLLAQILRKAGIAVEIFERDDGTRDQGWSVGLDRYNAHCSQSTLLTGPDVCRTSRTSFLVI